MEFPERRSSNRLRQTLVYEKTRHQALKSSKAENDSFQDTFNPHLELDVIKAVLLRESYLTRLKGVVSGTKDKNQKVILFTADSRWRVFLVKVSYLILCYSANRLLMRRTD